MAFQPEGMESSDWLVMMSPNNQPFSGKQIYVAERTRDRRSRQEEKRGEQREKKKKQTGRLFVTEVETETKMRITSLFT